MEIVPGFYESKIHMLYRQNGNTSTTNESSNGQNVTIQLMYTTRKDSDIILTKQIADLKCPLILPGKHFFLSVVKFFSHYVSAFVVLNFP